MVSTEKKEIINENKADLFKSALPVILPVILGAILYYLFCPEVWFVRLIDGLTGREGREVISFSEYPVLKFIRCYAFDFLWAFALANAVNILLGNNAKSCLHCLIIPLILGAVLELLQKVGIAAGTCDLWDAAAEGLGAGLAAIIIKYRRFKL